MRAGTLYFALDRLRVDGLVDVEREEVVDSRLRRYYRLAPEGRRELAAEADRVGCNGRIDPPGSGRRGVGVSEVTDLEAIYRRWLRWYSSDFRREHAEEGVSMAETSSPAAAGRLP